MKLNCRPGDLAVTVEADFPENLGNIVRVVRAHDNSGRFVWGEPSWWCVTSLPMHWRINGQDLWATEGAVPDRCIRPIRPPGEPTAVSTQGSRSRGRGRSRTFEAPEPAVTLDEPALSESSP